MDDRIMSLPKIYHTSIPSDFKHSLETKESIIVLTAPTGIGKTIMANAIMAELSKTIGIKCTSIMPFRVSVREIWSHLTQLFPDLTFGYAMRGESHLHHNDHLTINTVGYYLEKILKDYKINGIPKMKQIVMVDEAHDSTWQTDLTIKILLWLQKKGAPIQIVITSATLDITSILGNVGIKLLSLDNESAMVDVMYLTEHIWTVQNGKLTNDLIMKTIYKVLEIIQNSNKGDILIMLPGQEDILNIIHKLENKKELNDCIILPLYGSLDQDSINFAVRKTTKERKIICSTNIVENAITIKDLDYLIDCGYRKINVIDSEGASQLILQPASKSNLKQSLGRVGRLNNRGKAYLMLTENEYIKRPDFSSNESERNPLYHQIIKIIDSGLPLNEILENVDPIKLRRDLEFLTFHEAIDCSSEKITTTSIGCIMANLPLSIRASHFLAKFLILGEQDPILRYFAVVVACWMDCTLPIFYKPPKKPREDMISYLSRIAETEKLHEQFFEIDCLTTFIGVWCESWINSDFKNWCMKNAINGKTLKELEITINHTISALETHKLKIDIPNNFYLSLDEKTQYLKKITSVLVPIMIITQKDRLFALGNYNHYTKCYPSDSFTKIYQCDKFSKNKSTIDHKYYEKIIALSIQKLPSTILILSKIVVVP